jgi:hypothetical protein
LTYEACVQVYLGGDQITRPAHALVLPADIPLASHFDHQHFPHSKIESFFDSSHQEHV